MPLYEYRCDGCNKHMEQMVSRMDTPAPDCPDCSVPMVKIPSFASISRMDSKAESVRAACPSASACGSTLCGSGSCDSGGR